MQLLLPLLAMLFAQITHGSVPYLVQTLASPVRTSPPMPSTIASLQTLRMLVIFFSIAFIFF